ncbi:MAG: tetratricopeptide repeat protein [Candidatus Zixiibacteriota bacterium]
MITTHNKSVESSTKTLSAKGYWPAVAAKYYYEKKYSKAVEICKENLSGETKLLSSRLIYARSLYHAGQVESASDLFYYVLTLDPDNLVALKYLGDIKFAEADEVGAIANYQKILEIDPHCRALCASIKVRKISTTRTITLKRSGTDSALKDSPKQLRKIYFYTETIADLYLEQGFPGLAAEVYRHLLASNQNPKLVVKLLKAEEKNYEKDRMYVKEKN